MKSRTYENQQKQTVYVVECACDFVQFLYSKPKSENSSNGTNTPYDTNVAQNGYNAQNNALDEVYDNASEFEFNEEDIQF